MKRPFLTSALAFAYMEKILCMDVYRNTGIQPE